MEGAVAIAKILHVSELTIASTIIAIGTGLPTIAVNMALLFTQNGNYDILLGNALGTNFVNIGLALGIPALLVTMTLKYEVFEKEIPLYLGIVGVLTAFSLDGMISMLEGIILLVAYVVTLVIIYQYSKREQVHDEYEKEIHLNTSTIGNIKTKEIGIYKSSLYIALGTVVLVVASLLLTKLAPMISIYSGLSLYVIGLTIVGVGTSLPTIATSIRASLKGYNDIVVGNVFGGTIANIALAIGLPAIFVNLPLGTEGVNDLYLFSILSLIVIFFLLIEMKLLGKSKALNRLSGIVIISFYIYYILAKIL